MVVFKSSGNHFAFAKQVDNLLVGAESETAQKCGYGNLSAPVNLNGEYVGVVYFKLHPRASVGYKSGGVLEFARLLVVAEITSRRTHKL